MASTPIPQSSKLKWTWPPLIRKENILQVNIEMRGKGEVPSMKLILKWYQLHLDYLSLTCNISSFHCLGKATVLSCNSRMRVGFACMSCRREQSLGQGNSTFICLPAMYLVIIRFACMSCKREQSLGQGNSTYICLPDMYLVIIRFACVSCKREQSLCQGIQHTYFYKMCT